MPAEVQGQNVTESALKQLVDIQSMIDIMSERLVALRDLRLQEYIKQDIRSLEGKLLKHFWKQLTTKCKVPKDYRSALFQDYPSLSQWLIVVGVGGQVNKRLNDEGYSVESLLEFGQNDISTIVRQNGGDFEDERKLLAALEQLNGFKDRNGNDQHDTEGIFWDSWCKASHTEGETADHSPVVNSEMDHNENIQRVAMASGDKSAINRVDFQSMGHHSMGGIDNVHCDIDATNGQLIPPKPHNISKNSLSSGGPPSPQAKYANRIGKYDNEVNIPVRNNICDAGRTIPLNEPHSKNLETTNNPNLLLPFGQMKAARSYEWQIGNHITSACEDNITDSNLSLTSITTLPPPSSLTSPGSKLFSGGKKRKKRPGNIIIQGSDRKDPFLSSDPPDLIDLLRSSGRKSSSFTISPENGMSSTCASTSPLSPRTPITPVTPFNNEMWIRGKDFPVPHTPKTPGKIKVGLRAFKEKIKDKMGLRSHKLRRNKSEERVADEVVTPSHSRLKPRSDTFPVINVSSVIYPGKGGDLSDHRTSQQTEESRLSTHSSSSSISESSRQLIRLHHDSSSFDAGLLSSGMTTPGEASMLSGRDNFGFDAFAPSTDYSETDILATEQLVDSTLVLDNQPDVIENEQEQATANGVDGDVVDTVDDEYEMTMRTNFMRQTSTTSNRNEEWDIPWDELDFQELIGRGRVGAVYRGKWHGEVAIRVIDLCHTDDIKLHAFKHEVMMYKKTRHDNIELFMGSCMNPPKLAIVTGFCRGKSLYHYIRSIKDQHVNLNQAKIIAQHIAQGMGYLHSRGIVHKDLKSKNVFVDGKRVVLTDFGLMGLHAITNKELVMKPETLQIPDGWLCYMAPEVITALNIPRDRDVVSSLPYTKESDVYAFGVVWYELLTGSWPFSGYPAESIIWQVGIGKKQSLAHLQGPKELKDILMACWAYDPSQRPDFSDAGIMGHLLRLPQAKIIRRSSQPVKSNKKGGRLGASGSHDLFSAGTFASVLHDLAE